MNATNLFSILLCLDTLLAGVVLGVFIFYLLKVRGRRAVGHPVNS